ncbi:MAG: polysulfide reductase NrfD [Rhodospirillum sp.]|nr:polysulfide reductase NrfD [Rhodospirillum sp.]MCF8490178.1 polysulfide reductase NrfD [Rhodospirillum sp.]MCF8501215.1 polysulfide reductase NrfD [Rhodospirillum sp.]
MNSVPVIVETVNISREVAWLPWAVQYFFLVGLALGGVFLSLPATLLDRADWRRAGRMALFAMVTCAIVAPVALLADLHQPGRFWHFYTRFTPWSWMSWGSLLLPAFVGSTVLLFWLALRPTLPRWAALGEGDLSWLVKPASALAAVLALFIALYSGAEVMVVRSRPLWNTPFLPTMFLFTGLAGAAGLALIFNRALAGYEAQAERKLMRAAAVFSALVLVNGGLWLASGLTGWSDPTARALASMVGEASWMALAAWAAATALILLVLGWMAPRGWGWVLGLVALHSAWMFRWSLFIGGQELPKTGAGQYAYHMPLGAEGLTGILGTFGLWLALAILLTSLPSPDRRSAPTPTAHNPAHNSAE